MVEVGIEAVIARVPEPAITLGPLGDALDWRGLKPHRSPLGIATTGHEAGALENFEVFRDRRSAHGEGLGELADGALPVCEARDDGAPSGISQGGKGERQLIRSRHALTVGLLNL